LVTNIEKVKKLINEKKISYLPTFVHKTEEYNDEIGDYLLHVGRIEEHKGILDAIKAVAKTSMELKIVGNSSTGYDKVLKSYVKKKKIENVFFLGPRYGQELASLYRGSRAVIIPTIWYENMPNVALEAMIFSKPVVSSDIGSMKDIVIEGENGLLFKPRDINQIKSKIELLKDDELCRKLGKRAYENALKIYDPEKHYQGLMRIFNKFISNPNK